MRRDFLKVRRLVPSSAHSALVTCIVVVVGSACGGGSSGGAPTATLERDPSAPPLDRLTTAYHDPNLEPSRDAWADLLADGDTNHDPISVVEFVRLRTDASARATYDAYLDTFVPAVQRVGGELVSVNDTLMPGLEGLEGYDGGVSWAATFPSISAYVDAMLDEGVIDAASKRREAVDEAQILAGPNLVPDLIKRLPPNEPASAFPSDRVIGRNQQQIVSDLLAVYPSGGADPTKSTLESIVDYNGFEDQRVFFINLYKFNDEPGGGEAALGEYNAEALPAVLAHGGRPKVLANVSHHLVGPTAWDRYIVVSWPSLAVFMDLRLDPVYLEAQKSRVVSANQYGNLIGVARGDHPAAAR